MGVGPPGVLLGVGLSVALGVRVIGTGVALGTVGIAVGELRATVGKRGILQGRAPQGLKALPQLPPGARVGAGVQVGVLVGP